MKGDKFDSGKLRYDLVIPLWNRALATVLTFGAKKYEDNGWKEVEGAKDRYYAALQRHLLEYREGRRVDNDSHLPHLWHVLTNVCFLIYFEDKENG